MRVEESRSAYDAASRMTGRTVENGGTDLVTTYGYDPFGHQISVTYPNNNVTTSEYDLLGHLVQTQGAAVQVDGDPGEMALPTTTFGIDVFGQQTRMRDPLGHVTASEFNAAGWLVEQTSPTYTRPSDGAALTATTAYARDLLGRTVSVTDPTGATSTSVYDSRGAVVRTQSPGPEAGDEAIGTSTYDDAGRQVMSTGAAGLATTTAYDGLDRPVLSVEAVAGIDGSDDLTLASRTSYDAAGNAVRQVDPAGGVTTASFNAAGEQVSLLSAWRNAHGGTDPVTFAHDPSGRVVKTVDETGRRTETDYDLSGRAITERSYDTDTNASAETQRVFDGNGNLVAETSPRASAAAPADRWATTFAYDAGDRLTSVVEPVDVVSSIATRFGYDLAGNRTRLVDGRGNVTTESFNSWGLSESLVEPATAATPDPEDRTITTSYDEASRPVVRTEPGGIAVASTYDGAGNLTGETGTATDPSIPDVMRRMRFDVAGRLVSSDSPDGQTGYEYDQRGLLVAQVGPDRTDRFSYDEAGRLVKRVDGRGTASFAWSVGGPLASMADPVSGRHFSFGYDLAGRRTSAIADTAGFVPGEGLGDRQTTTTSYDGLGRATSTSVVGPEGDVRYREVLGLDLDGNVTVRQVDGSGLAPGQDAGAGTFTYDRAARLTSEAKPGASATPIGWDPSGNRTSVGSTTYSYDERNRLTSVSDGTTLEWSPAGARRTITTADGTDRELTFDALGQPVTDGDVAYEWDSQGRMASRTEAGDTQSFAYDGTDLDPTAVGAVKRGTDPSGSPVSVGTEVVSTNGHGDVVAASTATGAVTATGYDPFGASIGDAVAGPFGFQGDYTDPTSGDVWMGARTYDPSSATFSVRDTWGGDSDHPVTLNRFSYCNANPLTNFDSDGHSAGLMGGMSEKRYVDMKIMANLTSGPVQSTGLYMEAKLGLAAIVTILATSGTMVFAGSGVMRAKAQAPPGVIMAVFAIAIIAYAMAAATLTAVSMTEWLIRPIITARDMAGDAVDIATALADTIVDTISPPAPTTQPASGESDGEPNNSPTVVGVGDLDCNPVQQLRLLAEKGSSRRLRANMRRIGILPPVGGANEAHHIVAAGMALAYVSRLRLASVCIGINDAVNGIFLERGYHRSLHTNLYVMKVNMIIAPQPSSRRAVEMMLESIAARLAARSF